MINKTLSHGVKLIKISTWLSAIAALLLILLVGFFSVFPALLKSPIEQNLSTWSGMHTQIGRIKFETDYLDIKVHLQDIELAEVDSEKTRVQIESLRFNVDLLSLLNDIYQPSDIRITQLALYPGMDSESSELSLANVRSALSAENLQALSFFNSLVIDKTMIQAQEPLELGRVELRRDQDQLNLSVSDQLVDDQRVNIAATLSAEHSNQTGVISIPMRIDNDRFSFLANLKLYSQGDDFIEFEGFLPDVPAVDIASYTKDVVGAPTYRWMKKGFRAGSIQDLKLTLRKNLSTDSEIQTNLSASLVDVELLFAQQWQVLKGLQARLNMVGDYIAVRVDKAQLYDLELADIQVQIPDLSQAQLSVEVMGELQAPSQQVTQFLIDAPLGETVNEVLAQFELEGAAKSEVYLSIPLDQREAIVEVDVQLDNNRLSTLGGAVVVNNYDSRLGFRQGKITAQGRGNIRQSAYDININPGNRGDDDQALVAIELINNQGFEAYITQRHNQSWRARLESENLKGNVELILNDGGAPTVRLLGFQISKTEAIQGDWQLTPSDFVDMYLESESMFVDELEMPNFSAELSVQDNLLAINNLVFQGVGVSDESLSFNGFWVDGRTRLYTKASGNTLSEFLQKLRVKEPVKGGEFAFDVRLSCECSPWNMDTGNTIGYATLEVKEGEFSDQDPNIGRVFSLLNIDSISRRLKLNVDDLVSKGFVYDSIDAKVYLGNSLASIDEFVLDSTSSDIWLSGESNYVEKTYNLEAKVKPEIADSVPAATYLAGGGLAGLGVWLADEVLFEGKMIERLIDKVVDFKYKISGPWDAPKVENISSIL